MFASYLHSAISAPRNFVQSFEFVKTLQNHRYLSSIPTIVAFAGGAVVATGTIALLTPGTNKREALKIIALGSSITWLSLISSAEAEQNDLLVTGLSALAIQAVLTAANPPKTTRVYSRSPSPDPSSSKSGSSPDRKLERQQTSRTAAQLAAQATPPKARKE